MTTQRTNPKIDAYLSGGCMRCKRGGTPNCKVHSWQEELKKLRSILLDCGLTEELKWSQPCYTYQKRNVLIMAAFKDYCAINFFKGSLLKDTNGILTEHTQAGRQIRFTSVRDIVVMEPILKAYVYEAIEIEKSGLKPHIEKNPEPIPEEFQKKLDEIPSLKAAFEALTPGRQRAYIIYFSAPKQSKTRESRIEKYMQHILDGKPFYK
ncbi:MAG: YdeI/OmpD-associated family protein [Alicyclobacillus sp.]|nr:YdeI/OmpD-associated family protein [Alicyclobacillus sp.]